MKKIPLHVLIFSLISFFASNMTVHAQISGIINKYSAVTAIDNSCNTVTVSTPGNFAVGNLVMLIQMKGAVISTAASAAYGSITSINSAGNYELLRIYSISGNVLTFDNTISRTYETNGRVQLVYIPEYTNVSVSATLTAQPWNGQTGGVLALSASGTVTMNADLNVDGLGFAGGLFSESPGADCGFASAYVYPISVTAGRKGEGITDFAANAFSGRGRQANGGGGGNTHNTGGAGGANYGGGGSGGSQSNGCGSFYVNTNAFGGAALGTAYTVPSNKIFAGGGGGGGHQNDNEGSNGAAGGGIVYMEAATLTGNGYSIFARGNTAVNSGGDGAGGGGGGGTILLRTSTYTTTLTLNANAGNGGSAVSNNRFLGPGGGGGGGTIWLSVASLPAGVTATAVAGTSGTSFNTGAGTNDGNHGSTAGQPGAVLFNLSVPQSTAANSCALPVVLLELLAAATETHFILSWKTASEQDNAGFRIEKSTDGKQYIPAGFVPGNGNTSNIHSYSYTDDIGLQPLTYYRLIQVDKDGREHLLGTRVYTPDEQQIFQVSLYPNPSFNGTITVEWLSSAQDAVTYSVHTADGKLMLQSNSLEPVFTLNNLSPGFYIITFISGTSLEKRTFTVQ